ncbi:hypothetical protein AB4Z55_23935 [Gordonia sp. ABKF26]|uniref:hypothetical protein n=1 Tax=Gordonia sp. ABKF26 TaxID=3238687 RepID=UPI0034E5A547
MSEQIVSFNPSASSGSKFSPAVIAEIEAVAPGGSGSTAWADITDKPAVIAAGADAAAARTVIGAGGLDVTNTWSTTQTIQIAAIQNLRTAPAARTASLTLTTSSATVNACNATSAAIVVTLPATTIAGIRFVIKKIDASANTVQVAATAIDGAASVTLSTQWQWVEVISTSTSGTYYIIGRG